MMRKYSLIITQFLLLVSAVVNAQQAQFLTSGNIEFERSDNMYTKVQKSLSAENILSTIRFEQYKKQFPQFKLTKSNLLFSKQESLFTPEKAATNSSLAFSAAEIGAQMNIVYTSFQNYQQVIQKNVFEENFLVKDSIGKIIWKITDETRVIAGFNCRRANGLVLDSVYVVAFYAEEIPVSGGPESFGGLPGMILGMAIPQEHVTWFAKTVKQVGGDINIKAPAKGKVTNRSGLLQLLRMQQKSAGVADDRYLLPFFL